MALRIGIDVGGTFTKAAAVEVPSQRLAASSAVLTTHSSPHGVNQGVVEALKALLGQLNGRRDEIELVAFSTTQAMNALLEGDVATVGVIGMGQAPDLRAARKRTDIGDVELAPGRHLKIVHDFVDTSKDLPLPQVEAAIKRAAASGAEAIAVSEAYSVDAPDHEATVSNLATKLGLPTCAGHELVGSYGLETRTVSAAINASILPVVKSTAELVNSALEQSELDVPLLVLRGDGGAMDVSTFRKTPVFTLSSGPAAGVAAALHELGLSDGVVFEAGGTSSNISIIKQGRPTLRTIRVMGRPTCVRSLDCWVVGAAGGSMARIRRRHIAEVGPRSAHIAGLPYACFSTEKELASGNLALIAPRRGDPQQYAAIESPEGSFAITATCAANALGLVPAGDNAHGSAASALLAFELIAERLRRPALELATEMLDRAAVKIAEAVEDALSHYKLPAQAPIVALGGAAGALANAVGEKVGRSVTQPDHAELLSSVGAALSLVRVQLERSTQGSIDTMAMVREAEHSCVKAGAAPNTVSVETAFDYKKGVVRAIASGSIALEVGAAQKKEAAPELCLANAARALGTGVQSLRLAAETEYYRVFCQNGSGKVAVIDPTGAVTLAEKATNIICGPPEQVGSELDAAVNDKSIRLGLATVPPRVFMVCGPHLLDLSFARGPEEIVAQAKKAITEHPELPVAIVAR